MTMERSKINQYQNIPYLGCASEYLEEITDNIDQFSIFMQFNDQELRVLAQHLHCYAAPRGYLLFEQGQLSDQLIIILSGEVKIQSAHNETTKLLSAGSVFGSESFVDQHEWNASCMVNKPIDFATINQDGLNAILMHNPRLGNRFLLAIMQSMVVKIRAIEQHVDQKTELLLS